MGQYDDGEYMLPMYAHLDTTKQGCDHLDTVNRTWIHLKKQRLAIRAPRFVVDHTIEYAPICDAASRVAEAMVSELRFHAAANVVELASKSLKTSLRLSLNRCNVLPPPLHGESPAVLAHDHDLLATVAGKSQPSSREKYERIVRGKRKRND
ncbi:hypothetical protein TNCV_1847261 [Trichonephila clavipes]|nr:hypothetical protein TNCV_1847261 [Trichonephila clavipes]